MTNRIVLTATFACAVLAAGTPAFGHAKPLNAEEMVRGSRYVVVATVVDQSAVRRGAAGLIVTRYRLATEESLRGGSPKDLTVEVVGGTIDGQTDDSCLTVHLALGGRYVLFVNDLDNPGFSTFTGAQQGVFAEVQGEGGESSVHAATGAFVACTGGGTVTFSEFVGHLRDFIHDVEASPAPPPAAAVVNDPPLPAKRLTRSPPSDSRC